MDHGGKPTFDELYQDCEARVYGYCWRLCNGNEAEAEDLAQDTFIRAYRGLAQFEGRSSVLTWLFQIARNEWIRARKKKQDTLPLEGAGVPEQGHDPTPGHLRQLWITGALQRLPDHLREALILVKSEGLTYREAAEVLGIPQGTVQFHVHQAMKQMRGLLAEQLGVPAALGMVLALFLQQSLRAEVTTPQGLMGRIYGAIGQPVPERAAVSGRAEGTRTRQLRPHSVLLALFAVVVIGVSLPGLWGRLINVTPPAPAGPRDRLAEVLSSLSRVQTAHAYGVTHYERNGRGLLNRDSNDVEYWYKVPNKYLLIQRRSGKIASRTIVEGNRGAIQPGWPNESKVLPLDATSSLSQFSPISIFRREGELARNQGNAQVSLVVTDGGYGATELLSAEVAEPIFRRRWLLYVNSGSTRPVRIEYEVNHIERATFQIRKHTVLESIEYDLPILDSLFDLSRSE